MKVGLLTELFTELSIVIFPLDYFLKQLPHLKQNNPLTFISTEQENRRINTYPEVDRIWAHPIQALITAGEQLQCPGLRS